MYITVKIYEAYGRQGCIFHVLISVIFSTPSPLFLLEKKQTFRKHYLRGMGNFLLPWGIMIRTFGRDRFNDQIQFFDSMHLPVMLTP